MSGREFLALLVDLIQQYPHNAVLKSTAAHLAQHGGPQPQTDPQRYAWQRETLVVAGLRTELHRITPPH